MKKVLAMAAIALFMVSCSDDDSTSNNNQDTVLVKKTIEVFDGGTLTNTYSYNGTKLIKIVGSDASETTFTYTGELLTKSEYHSTEFDQEDIYTYNSNNTLKSNLRLSDNDYAVRTEFTYNQNGTITATSFYGTHDVQDTPDGTVIITMNNGNIVSAGNSTYTFDSKNSPFKNIKGYNFIILEDNEGGLNNILTSSNTVDTETYTYTYNAANYPLTESVTYTENGETYTDTTQYFYE